MTLRVQGASSLDRIQPDGSQGGRRGLGDTRASLPKRHEAKALQCPALPSPALGSQRPERARRFLIPLRSRARVERSTAVQPAEPRRARRWPGEAQCRRQSPCRPRPAPLPTPPQAPGRSGRRPDPQGQRWRAAPGPARARRRGVGTKAPCQRLPYNGLALQAARLSPATRHPRASALTSGQRGTVVHRDPDLLHPALSQFQGHLHSLDLAALCPLRRIQT